MDFSEALKALKVWKRVARAGWNGKGMFIFLTERNMDIMFNTHTKNQITVQEYMYAMHPMFVIKGTDDNLSVWLPSQTDLLADDWELVE